MVHGACQGVRRRSEIRELSEAEMSSFIGAILELKRRGKYDGFVVQHVDGFPFAHNSPAFFPWHRKYLLNFEDALREIDPDVTVPYWDWTLDSQAPEASPIFTWFGGNGEGEDNCLKSGPFANWRTSVPEQKCLQRQFDLQNGLISPLQSPELLHEDIATSKNYSTLQTVIEMGTHSLVHVGIGGEGGDMSFEYSSNDPIFWLVHSFVDKIWSTWQSFDPKNALSYDGINPATNKSVALTDVLDVFGTQVKDVMSTKKLCYRYSQTPAIPMPNNDTSISRPSHSGSSENDIINIIKRRFGEVATSNSYRKRTILYGDIPAYFDIYGGPTPDDRSEKYQLRVPMGLPQKFINKMGYPTRTVRTIENTHGRLTRIINLNKEYISPVSLAKKLQTELSIFG
ncbi:Di-copper centre-containing protein [Basidiobolus meristosporus CBS 931.73]|uniref:Di-copper centre-containing protein n=1 Tax=Basidiobolus meristosporus CBS 931.73 TaxID=1314790 RepID=A0A1Y1X7W0_9FUNG|nr:Di-copper centre-containing protein [Basidiobolus meristosporus CBS 931.73]|eukprot:ORX81815.1 Di-copper centre-containing protein [Basidiobolus meristosporus CBS 931.73]